MVNFINVRIDPDWENKPSILFLEDFKESGCRLHSFMVDRQHYYGCEHNDVMILLDHKKEQIQDDGKILERISDYLGFDGILVH